MVMPILSGPGRGLLWVTGSGTHGCWLGTYERDRQQQLTQLLRSGDCFLDIGANVGFYSLLASRIVGKEGCVHAFEPFPRNVEYITRHIEMNRITNIEIHPIALSDGEDRRMSFSISTNPSAGHLSENSDGPEQISVPVAALDSLWRKSAFPSPSMMKIDVEGAEYSVLNGGKEMIAACRPVILLAGHGSAVQERCCDLLRSWSYRIKIDRNGSLDGMYESTAWPN